MKRGHEAIKAAMQRNEREVLAAIRRTERKGERYSPLYLCGSWGNALDRLVKKGKVKLVRSRSRWGGYFYKEVA